MTLLVLPMTMPADDNENVTMIIKNITKKEDEKELLPLLLLHIPVSIT
jgi:hypothetical protein